MSPFRTTLLVAIGALSLVNAGCTALMGGSGEVASLAGGPSSSMTEAAALTAAERAVAAVPGGSVAKVVASDGLFPLLGNNAFVVFEPVSFNEVHPLDLIAYLDPVSGKLGLTAVQETRPDRLIVGPVLTGTGPTHTVAPDQVAKRVVASFYFRLPTLADGQPAPLAVEPPSALPAGMRP